MFYNCNPFSITLNISDIVFLLIFYLYFNLNAQLQTHHNQSQIQMEQITTLTSAWIFDQKGNIKQVKNENDRPRAKQIYLRAKQALRYSRGPIGASTLRRISFVNGKKEWTITVSAQGEIIVMQKDESLS